MNKLLQFLQGQKTWKIFSVVLGSIIILGTLLSLVARLTFLRDNIETRPRIAVVAPLQQPSGAAVRQGVELYIERLNKEGGIKGRLVELLAVEETPEAAAMLTSDKRVVGVVGYLNVETLQKAAPVFKNSKLPLVTPRHLSKALPGVTSVGIDPTEEARFVANYARNIQQQRLMYVIREKGAEYDALVATFVDVYQRFNTPVQKVWVIDGHNNSEQLKTLFAQLRQINVGAVYIAASSDLSAHLVKGVREAGNALEVFGASKLASGTFIQSLAGLSGNNAAIQSHGAIAATPVLFDTANDEAQRFQTRYQQKFSTSPDWLATLAYDAAQIVVSEKPGVKTIKGISGELAFENHQAQLPIQVGIYNGDSLISAPVQLLPIAKGANFNYIDALRQGRVLYVNDRFMFKTNVVYVGLTINEVSDLNKQSETATIDLSIWFRYRGKFDPQNMQILNAVEPVSFATPEESKDSDDVQYRRYRIKQKFNLNFTNDERAYGHHVAGLAFRHRLLNRNNLMLVVDVLGMPTGNSLLDDLQLRRVVKAGSGWALENAWVSQDMVRERGDGAPQYVGMTGEQPLFSTITLGALVKPESITARDLIAGEYFIYIAIFGFLGMLAAVILDSRKLGRYWSFQSWLLRLLFWPMALLAAGNLLIDWSFASLAPATTLSLATVYDSLWWLLGARLADMAVRRFIWNPLEDRAGRKVPNVMKALVSILIFGLAFAGIVAVVLNETLTSLLATSGVLAMIIGLAIQANISNIFSGIVLNIERPFKVGDYIKINDVLGQVKDITWRTVRVESREGPMVSLSNSVVSESFMENYSAAPFGIIASTIFYAPPNADPALIKDIINVAVAQSKFIEYKDDPANAPEVHYNGIENFDGSWAACFEVRYRVKHMGMKAKAQDELWTVAHQKFVEHGISLTPESDM